MGEIRGQLYMKLEPFARRWSKEPLLAKGTAKSQVTASVNRCKEVEECVIPDGKNTFPLKILEIFSGVKSALGLEIGRR